MDVLVEVHDMAELERALQVPAPLLGINNRNLRTFEVSLDTTLALKEAVPGDRRLLTESGILAPGDVQRMRAAGVDRSEEHTSELQSLMRLSYAVFCLKKKKKKHTADQK